MTRQDVVLVVIAAMVGFVVGVCGLVVEGCRLAMGGER